MTILALRARDKRQKAKEYAEQDEILETRSTPWPSTSSAMGTMRSLKSFRTNPIFEGDDISLDDSTVSTISKGNRI